MAVPKSLCKLFPNRSIRHWTNSSKSIYSVPPKPPWNPRGHGGGGHPTKSLFTPGLNCFSFWPVVLVFCDHSLVFNSYNTISMLCFYVAPPSGISSIKAILVCPGYFQMALGVLLSFPSASLAPSPFTFSCFLSSPHMKVPSADLCLAGFILSSSENIKVSKSISWGSSSINGIHSFLICAAKLI